MGSSLNPRFEGKTILITGAARGIGRACAKRLAEERASVVGIDLDENGLRGAEVDVAAAGGAWLGIVGDLRNPATIDRAIDQSLARFSGLDGLVNNAAIMGPSKPLEETIADEFDLTVDVNLKAVWYALKAAYAPMRAGGAGAIVNISSMAAVRPSRKLPIYGMTKAGVVGLTLQAALEYANARIRVNCVCPGPVKTPAAESYLGRMPPAKVEELHRRIMRTTALNRYAEPSEIAAAVSFLLSDDASFITGAVLPVDGGSSVR